MTKRLTLAELADLLVGILQRSAPEMLEDEPEQLEAPAPAKKTRRGRKAK